MNYCIAAFAIIVIISTFQWFIDGRKNYKGPQVEVIAEDGTPHHIAAGEGFTPAELNGTTTMAGERRTAELDGAVPKPAELEGEQKGL